MDETRLKSLLGEAIAHCYDEEDEFWAIFSALVGRVSYPLQVRIEGEEAILVGMDGAASAPEVGVMARVQRGTGEVVVLLDNVEVVTGDPDRLAWLEVYRYWRGGGR